MLTKGNIKAMMFCVVSTWKREANALSEIDAKFGDGDHGITIGKIANMIEQKTNEWNEQSIYTYFSELGTAILDVKGGSAGPLYGTLIGGFAEGMDEDAQELDASAVKAMYEGSLEEMQLITKAKVGDKTMMDALIPAVEAAKNAADDIEQIIKEAAKGAKEGAKASENFVSKFGRARSYKEHTIGTPDAGALSTSLLFEAMAQGYMTP